MKHNSKVTNNGHRANQRTADAQLPGVKIRAPSTSRAPKKLRLLGMKTKSVRPHPLRDPPVKRSRAKIISPRQALDQHVVVDGIKSCRKIEQAEQCIISRINRLNEVGHDLEKRSLRRMELSIG